MNETLTALLPLIPQMLEAGKSAWNIIIKPALKGLGYNMTKEQEQEIIMLEEKHDIEKISEILKNIENELNRNIVNQTYEGDNGSQVGINNGVVTTVNINTQNNVKNEITLSEKARQLLKEISLDQSGTLTAIMLLGGYLVQTNHKQFGTDRNNAREQAEMDSAIEELEKYDLIRATSYKREMFTITGNGYKVADKI
jgi:hypothetical protein